MAVTHEQASTSVEFILMSVSARESGVDLNVTTNSVSAQFVPEGDDPPTAADPDWETATWETDATTAPDTYYARVLVGPSPGVVQLTPGVWQPYLMITDAPEVVIRKADGQVRIV